MDFGALPPEINSARMYSGPGSTPMLGAASAWDELATELYSAADSYLSVLSGLTGAPWSGPASASMLDAATPYASWMSATAGHAQQTAARAKAVAGAYEIAFAAMVPPPEIAANRSLLMSLVATNILGQNSPAIATTEAQYAEMWAQDAAAMYGYADASSVATAVTPFSTPPQTTALDGSARQQAAVAKAAAKSSEENASTELVSAARGALRQLSSSSASASASAPSDSLQDWFKKLRTVAIKGEQILMRFTSITSHGSATLGRLVPAASGSSATASVAPAIAPGALAITPGAVTGPVAGAVSGGSPGSGLGRAGTIGRLSVPPSWVTGPSAATPGMSPMGVSPVSADPASPAGMMRGIPMSGGGRRVDAFVNRYGFRHNVIPRPPAAG